MSEGGASGTPCDTVLTPTQSSTSISMAPRIENSALPYPTNFIPDPSKKSHAKKKPLGHIPRPRNAFILFRCDFVRQKKIPDSVEKDHRNISRIAGTIWREMNDQEREPWVAMAQEEKRRHMEAHPGYRFYSGKRKHRRGDDVPRETQHDEIAADASVIFALDRAYSAPPGALHIPQVNLEFLNGYGNPLKTRDDMARRPSRVTVYQSKPYDLKEEMADPEFFSDIVNQYYFAQESSLAQDFEIAFDDGPSQKEARCSDEEATSGMFCGPRLDLDVDSYPFYDQDYPPEWRSSPMKNPTLWTNWSDIHTESDGDTDTTYSQDSPPMFSNPFLGSIPPLPGTAYTPDPEISHPPEIMKLIKKYSSQYASLLDLPAEVFAVDSTDSMAVSAPPILKPSYFCENGSLDNFAERKSKDSFSNLPSEFRAALKVDEHRLAHSRGGFSHDLVGEVVPIKLPTLFHPS